MSIHRQEVTLANTVTAYPATPQVTLRDLFEPCSWDVINKAGAAAPTEYVYASFDGVNDHAELRPGTPTEGLKFTMRAPVLYLRRKAVGPVGSVLVEVIASTDN